MIWGALEFPRVGVRDKLGTQRDLRGLTDWVESAMAVDHEEHVGMKRDRGREVIGRRGGGYGYTHRLPLNRGVDMGDRWLVLEAG